MFTQLPWLFSLSDSHRVTSLLPVSVFGCFVRFDHFFSRYLSALSLFDSSRNDATLSFFLCVYLFYSLLLSQEEVLLSPFLSPRPGNGFPSFRYYANRLQPRSCAEVSVIMALLPLRSSPPLQSRPSSVHLSTF